MSQRQRGDVSIEPLPREPFSRKLKRYAIALSLALLIAAVLVVVASVIGMALAPLFDRGETGPVPAQDRAISNPELS